MGSLAGSKTEGQQIILGKNLLLKSITCEGTKQCDFMLARDQQSGVTSAFYEVYDPETNKAGRRVTIPTNIGETMGKVTLLTSTENLQKLQQIQTLIEQRRYGEVSNLLKNEPFEEDPALRQHLLKTTGIDLQQLNNPEYTQKLNEINNYYSDAHTKIKTLRDSYGINLDEKGVPVSTEDQQKLNEILNKKRSGNEIAAFDLYSGARVDLARAENEQVEAMHQSCAGNAYCPVGDEDVKAAQQKVINEVLRREKSPEGIQWRQNFELQKEQKEQQKEVELLADKLADAQKLGKKRDATERTLTRDQAVLAKTIQDLNEQEAKVLRLEQERKEKEKSIQFRDVLNVVFTLGEGIEQDLDLQRSAEELAKKELTTLELQEFSLQTRIKNGKEGLKKINEDINDLTLNFKEPTSKLALLSASGDDETVGMMIHNSDLPSAKKDELYQTYLGSDVSKRLKEISADQSVSNYDEKQKQMLDIIGTGKMTLKRAQNYAEQYGDIGGSKVVLDHVKATRPDLVDTPEWRTAQNAYDAAVDNQIAELRQVAEQNLREKMKLSDGTESSIFGDKNSIADWTLSKLGAAAESVGSGIRSASFNAVAGTLAVAGGASYLVGAEETGTNLLDTATALHTFDDVKKQQANAELRLLDQQIKSYDKVQEIIANARLSGKEPDTALIQNAFRTQAPITNLAKQMEGKELTVDDQAQAALYNVEQSALVAGGDELVKNQYIAIREEFAGKSEVADIAKERVLKAEQRAEGSFLTNEQLGLYGDALIDVSVDVTNIIPGVVFVKAGKAVAKFAEVTKIAGAASKIGHAIDVVKDAGKLLTVSKDARLALKAAKAELYAAQVTKGLTAVERTAEIARAEQKINLARQAVEGEYRASKVGRVTNVLSTPVSSDLRAIEKLKLATQDEQFKAAQQLQAARTAEEVQTAQEAYKVATQRVSDIEKTKEAYSLAGSYTGGVTWLGKERAVGPGAKKAQQALDEFQQAREAYHVEKIAFGADKVSAETVENIIKTAKAAEEAKKAAAAKAAEEAKKVAEAKAKAEEEAKKVAIAKAAEEAKKA
ncbi:MAG: hypothetical protein AABX24_04080, partial [Nanoarchaeota archaeon]